MARNIMSVFGPNGRAPGAENPAAAEAAPGAAAVAPKQGAALALMTLGKTLVFKGEISADEDLVLFGRVEGSITHTGSVTIALGGVVTGNVHARTITIRGTVEGDVEATESATVAPSAVLNGDIVAPRVSIVDGAEFNGCVKMPPRAAAEAKKVVKAPASAPAPESKAPLSDPEAARVLGERSEP
ncbi:MAG TPA: polymer-forming cytoskeletal protein [Steroidobacteraceae bacterium]|nr:polymer-forming cytoskeletal protein [Steroidobacteraceae bacterium]